MFKPANKKIINDYSGYYWTSTRGYCVEDIRTAYVKVIGFIDAIVLENKKVINKVMLLNKIKNV